MLDKKNWAVIGVTSNKDKYGYKIWQKLKEHGYKVYGVNPKYSFIDQEKVYSSLKDIPEKINVIDLVVPPNVSLKILGEAKEMDIEYIWFQPGTFNDKVIQKAKDLNFKILYNDCILATLIKLEKNRAN